MADVPSGDPVAARLSEIRERALWPFSVPESLGTSPAAADSAKDVPALLAAVQDVLKLAREWRQEGLALGAQITAEDADGARAGFMMCTAQAYENCANATRMTIRRALLGGDGNG